MLEKIGHIKNPLTVIAMFAAIAEVSGAIVLPFIEKVNQATYIWFLMIFPSLLVIVFFLTLNFNHKVLYAPSDWKDESNFFRMFTKATAAERKEKLRSEYADAEASTTNLSESPVSPPSSPPERDASGPESGPESGTKSESPRVKSAERNASLAKRYRLLERAAIARLSRTLGLDFQQDIVYQTSPSRRIVFDAVSLDANKVNAAEVRLILGNKFSPTSLQKILLEAELVAKSLREQNKEFMLHIVAILDMPKAGAAIMKENLHDVVSRFDLNIRIHFFQASDLEAELS